MKVLLIGFTKIAFMPYMNFYIYQLRKLPCEISLIYWDRDGLHDIAAPVGVEVFKHCDYVRDSAPLILKAAHFLRFRNYTKTIIGKHNFDLIILLHSTPGVLLCDIVMRKYSGRYVLDYRDLTYEHFGLFRRTVHSLIKNSSLTFVSSRGFLSFLPASDKICISHNLLKHTQDERQVRRNLSRSAEPIRIRFWGLVRHVSINQAIIDRLGNDRRFELHYHGREQEAGENLRRYVLAGRVTNVFFHGEYSPNERVDFASRTDLLHNLYENDNKTRYAMGNKYYDGITFYLPQLCNAGSFMGQEAELAGIGVAFDPRKPEFPDRIFDYYSGLNWDVFESKCDRALSLISEEYAQGMLALNMRLVHMRESNGVR